MSAAAFADLAAFAFCFAVLALAAFAALICFLLFDGFSAFAVLVSSLLRLLGELLLLSVFA